MSLSNLKDLQVRYQVAIDNAHSQNQDPAQVPVSLQSIGELIGILVQILDEQNTKNTYIPRTIGGSQKIIDLAPEGGNY